MAILLEGKLLAQQIQEILKKEIADCRGQGVPAPVLASVCVGENAAAGVYMKSQARLAEELGVVYRAVVLGRDTGASRIAGEIERLNADPTVTAVIVQTPVPPQIRVNDILSSIAPHKDAEGMHPHNLGRLLLGQHTVAPCTAQACFELLRAHRISLYGKEAVIVGHSDIVGKPLSLMFLKEFATTTVCHIATSEAGTLKEHIGRAQVLVVAVGKPQFIKGDWIREGAFVIDVGINRVGDRLVGDVDFDEAQKRASHITPVPGGVGPLTVTMLMRNCVALYKEGLEIKRD